MCDALPHLISVLLEMPQQMFLIAFMLAECAQKNAKTCAALRSQLAATCEEKRSDSNQSCTNGKRNPNPRLNVSLWNSKETFRAVCDSLTQNVGWTVILQRLDGSVSYNRKWDIYKRGFGDLDGDFFVGLDKIHALTAEKSHELLVIMEDLAGVRSIETYEKFAIGDESELYILHTLGTPNGTAGDELRQHHGMPFSTFDKDNDRDIKLNCAAKYNGGWWYDACTQSLLTGLYIHSKKIRGLHWGKKMSLKYVVMMIRPRSYC